MKLRDHNPTLEPAAKRELEALEVALAGEPVSPEHADLAALARELGELRPVSGERFAAELDSRAAAGFGGRRPGGPLGTAWERFRSAPMRRQLAPAAASALAAIVVATAVVASGGGDAGRDDAPTVPSTPIADSALESGGGGAAGAGAANDASGGRITAQPAPSTMDSSLQLRGRDSLIAPALRADDGTGPFGSGERRRFVERSAQLTLGTEPERIQDVAEDILGVVGRYGGIVLSSAIREGGEGEAGARFDLLIPSRSLGEALGDLSTIAELRSREESTFDITAPTVTVQERLRDARAEVEGLLEQLANTGTDAERAAVKAQLAFQRQRVAALRGARNALQRRANLSRVSLQVVTGDAIGFGPGEDSEWTLGDALRDAGRILAVAAGVTLIGIAVLAPIALIALLAWLTRRTWIRQSRERALEG